MKINNKKNENNGKCKLSAFLFYPILLNNYISSTIPATVGISELVLSYLVEENHSQLKQDIQLKLEIFQVILGWICHIPGE